MIRLALIALLSHWRMRPVQLVTLLGGLILSTALWAGVQALNAEARSSYANSAALLGQDSLDRLVPRPGARVSTSEFAQIRREGWLVSPVIDQSWQDANGARFRLLGIDPLTTPPRAGLAAFGEGRVDLAQFLGTPGVVLASPQTALRVGDDLPPVITVADVPDGTLITDITTAQRLSGVEGFDHLLIARDQPLGQPLLTNVTDLERRSAEDTTDIAALTSSFHLNLTAFGLLSFAVGLFIVQSAIGLAFEQRRATVRTLRALGVPLRSVVTAFAVELSLFSLAAGVIGLILGYAIATALMPGVAGTLQGLYGASISAGSVSFDPVWALSGLAMTLAGTALAGTQAVWRLIKMPLLSSALANAWARSARATLMWQTVATVSLLLLSFLLGWLGQGLIAGFACLAALLLGAALALPPLLSVALRLIAARVKPGLMQWIIADTRQQVPGMSLALMALLLALSANVGVGTMVGSFRTTFLGWLDQRLVAELYVTTRDAGEASDLRAYLQTQADVTAILPIWSVPVTLDDAPGAAFGITSHSTYSDHWPLITAVPEVWRDLQNERGILINEQLYRRSGLALGDPVQITSGWAAPVLGVYSDYGNTRPQIMVTDSLLSRHVVKPVVLRFAVRTDRNTATKLAADLRDRFNLPPSNVVDQSRVKAASVAVFDRTFVVTGALNVLTLGVAGFALWMSLLTLADLRLPQIAPVWSIGVSALVLARIDILRTLVLAAMTWVLAVPVGLVLAWVLLAIVNVQAFGWRLPMLVFPSDWVWLGIWALIATGLASLWPARALAKNGGFRLLRVFSHDA